MSLERSKAVFLSIGILMSAACSVAQLPVNGGFESGELSPWVSSGSLATMSSLQPHSGAHHLRLRADGSTDHWAVAFQETAAAPGERWEASVYALRKSGARVSLKVEFYSASGGKLEERRVTSTESGYIRLSIVRTAPEGTAFVRMVMVVELGALHDPVEGYFDDARLKRVGLKMLAPPP